MYCPNCSAPCGENDNFCTRCGTRLHDEPFQIPEAPKPKKGSHRVPILILVLLALIGTGVYFATAGSRTAAQEESETPWFEVWEGYLYFYPEYYTGPSEITVPGEIAGKAVIGLSEGCFENCTDITTVILPETLEEINSYAFAGCTALRGIYIPEATYVIGANAFYGCTDLEAVYISAGMRFIGPDTFDDCNSLWYIFYDGTLDSWDALYAEYITPYTGVFCEDGSFYQGGNPNE